MKYKLITLLLTGILLLSGKICYAQCLPGYYGPDCHKCHCTHGRCDSANGNCYCDEGWSGQNCDQPAKKCVNGEKYADGCRCYIGFYGEFCEYRNQCVHGTANDGRNGSQGCKSCDKGWSGNNCDKWGGETYTDPRDGHVYATVKIGGPIWLAENLAYSGVPYYHANNDSNNDKKYGYLYTWDNAQKACPPGWRLPNRGELEFLAEFGFKKLVAFSFFDGNDSSGFGALPAGYYYSGDYVDFGYGGYWWSATELNSSRAYNLYLVDGYADVDDNSRKTSGFSVRCLKDSN